MNRDAPEERLEMMPRNSILVQSSNNRDNSEIAHPA